jgi:chromosomal replication initiator protein
MSSPALSDPRDLARAWQAILGRLELEVTTHNFETWLRGTRPVRCDGTTLIVEARTSFNCDWLNQRLKVVVERAAAHVLNVETTVHFVVRDAPGTTTRLGEGEGSAAARPPSATRPARSVVGTVNCAYTFERYLPGEGNRLALQCCMSLLGSDDVRISPVVVWGAPGMGKTHLLHAVACRAAAGGVAVACLSAEEFTTRYMSAIRRGSVEEFQLAVRGIQILVVDDLQYLAGKKGTQDELVHTIDAVANAGGHVVVASERHPLDLDLPDRLASRLSAGIVARIEPLLAAERRAYVDQLARELRAALPAWAVDRIAGSEMPSVRVLQGAVHAAVALSRCDRLDLRHLDAELTRISVAESAPADFADRAIVESIARYFELNFADLVGRSRKPAIATARALAVAMLKERGRSLSEIGSFLGNRDRSTVSQLAGRGQELLAEHSALREQLVS